MPLTECDVNTSCNSRMQNAALSKLPRRVATAPSSTPSRASRVADRVASAEKRDPLTLSGNKRDSAVARKTSPLVNGKPLLLDKPLPSRPIARLSGTLSPSKDSRGLIDATEQPLRVTSPAGEKHEWPTLNPQTTSSTATTPTVDLEAADNVHPPTPCPTSCVTPDAVIAAATELTKVFTTESASTISHGHPSSDSRASSYASAAERRSITHMASDSGLVIRKTRGGAQHSSHEDLNHQTTTPGFLERHASLRNRITSGRVVTPQNGPMNKFIGFTDFTRLETATPTSVDSRPHSPSPASFSRPRPSSTSGCNISGRASNTASRIPIPDTKKATVVDVRKNTAALPSAPQSNIVPTFGSRRLASPDALKILENGKIRRQLKRTPTNASIAGQELQRSGTSLSTKSAASTHRTPSLSYSLGSSPEATVAPNSPEFTKVDSELTSNKEIPGSKSASLWSLEDDQRSIPSFPAPPSNHQDYPGPGSLAFRQMDGIRAPPPTSPFTAPLPTIPSQAMLSMNHLEVDDDTESELARTLSQLEGKGCPPDTEMDFEKLREMFAHLNPGLEKNAQTTSTFVENAAAAERYLAMRESRSSRTNRCDDSEQSVLEPRMSARNESADIPRISQSENQLHATRSKWSDSTPSNNELSPPTDDFCARFDLTPSQLQHPVAMQAAASTESVSIGYPSRIPTSSNTSAPQPSDETADVANIARRRSSPTLGKRNQGCVRNARAGINVATASYARTTASAESKKTARMPTPNTKPFNLPDGPQRGRKTSAEKKLNAAVRPKTPRSRSKSRTVLDKINGLFLGKREKRTCAEPPAVPRIPESDSKPTVVEVSAEGSPKLKPAKIPQLPKMPSLSPTNQTMLRSASRATIQTDDTTLVDSIALQDESQSVHILSEHLIGKAQREVNPQRKERLLSFAKVLSDSLISAREAQISAETAQQAAKSAQLSYEMTQKSLAMLQRLATSMARTQPHHRGV